ncbi:hypothetical protein TNCV_771361 [Trichonephila clavipes]|nr:hypothetical protein TNCV_771361 [Trichonephila clavipes]
MYALARETFVNVSVFSTDQRASRKTANSEQKLIRYASGGESTVTGSAYLDALQLWLFPELEESESDIFIWQEEVAPTR